nr:MAG TPA: hypothetical protein [Caudoviricetes sp.]
MTALRAAMTNIVPYEERAARCSLFFLHTVLK